VPAEVSHAFHGRILNIHPALLPAFGGRGMYGHRVHEAVVASGVRLSGATVHFVDEQYDHGSIIAQWPVPVFPDDTPSTVAIRVLEVEHQLFPRAVAAVAAGRVTLGADGRVQYTRGRIAWPHFAASDAAGAADAWDALGE
jgi:folate-dependent phosphoribosylglycinamide formyltransferase PurN